MSAYIPQTPPMGWNSWDCFGAGVTEKELRDNADYMAKHLLAFGWEYIVCDIQWYEPLAKDNNYNNFTPLCSDEFGRLIPAPNRFPSSAGGAGFKPIADYCHSLGLKFGIHILRGVPRQAVHAALPIKNSRGTCRDAAHPFSVCSWNTDMYGLKDCEYARDYYDSIIELYASWGVDFIKCDDICVTEFRKWDDPYNAKAEIEMLHEAIEKCGRDIVLSLSPGPADIKNLEHLRKNADMWRMTGDFWDNREKLLDMFSRCRIWQGVPSPGCWPDCDMLPLGRLSLNGECSGKQGRMTQFTKPEQYTLMTLWGIFRSPLMFGGNLPDNDDFTLSLLTNREYLNMHKYSYAAREVHNDNGFVIWCAEGDSCKYLAIFNLTDSKRSFDFDPHLNFVPEQYGDCLDVWNGTLLHHNGSVHATVDPFGTVLYKFSNHI